VVATRYYQFPRRTFSPEERRRGEPKEAPRTRILAPERVAELIAWLAASPPEFVLTEGVVLPIEEGLP
jgi:NADP-dependent 3-hydroxy acid dehydrogenase YdfG